MNVTTKMEHTKKCWKLIHLGLMTLTLFTNSVKAKETPTRSSVSERKVAPKRSPFMDNEVPQNKLPHFDQCGTINQVQSTVIQILNTHYEYGKGIHMLHNIVEGIQSDFSTLKSKIDDLDKRISPSHLYSENRTSHKPHKPDTPLPTLDPLTFSSSSAMSRSLQTLNWGLRNLTKMMQTQDDNYVELERKYIGLRRKLKKAMTLQNKAQMTGKEDLTQDHRYLLEHYMDKQTDINSKLVRRIQTLEQNIKVQGDAPYAHDSQAGCPTNFVRHFTSCYLFVNTTSNWIDAEKYCQGQHHKSHLVAIETREEAEYLVQYRLHNLEHWASNYIWSGANDIAEEGVWRWVGTDRILGYINWRPGQPDNHNDDQHCVYFRADGADPRWDDWHCYAARLNYVCEINMTA